MVGFSYLQKTETDQPDHDSPGKQTVTEQTANFDAPGFLSDLEARGIVLSVDVGQIRFEAPAGVFTPELRTTAAEHRGELLQAINAAGVGRISTRPANRPAIKWPSDAADFVLLLTPDDLPAVPFQLNAWTEVRDAAKFLRSLRADIRRGPSGPRAFYGAIQADLLELRRFALQASDKRQQMKER